jgi:hypothetical protein
MVISLPPRPVIAVSAAAVIAIFGGALIRHAGRSATAPPGPEEARRSHESKTDRHAARSWRAPSGGGRAASPKAANSGLLELLEESLAAGPSARSGFLERFAEVYPSLPAAERRRLLNQLADRLAVADLRIALELTAALSNPADARIFGNQIASALFKVSPAEAIRWVEGIDDERLAAYLLGEIGRRWAQSDLAAVQDWSSSLDDGIVRDRVLEGIIFTWTQADSEAAFEWAMAHADESLQDRMIAKIAKVLAATSPAKSAQWATQLPPSLSASDALHYATHRWAAQDRAAAVSWAEALEDSEVRAIAMKGTASSWAVTDPAGAAQWVTNWDTQEVSPKNRERALQLMANAWSARNPAEAIMWIGDFEGGSAALRTSLVEGVVRHALRTDPGSTTELVSMIQDPFLEAAAARVLVQSRNVQK